MGYDTFPSQSDVGESGSQAAALARIFDEQRARSRSAAPAPWALRSDRLRRLRRLILEQRGALAQAISGDFGHRSRHETELLEINPLLDGIAHSLRHGQDWMRMQRRRPGPKFWPGAARLLPQPLGVVGVIVPWNYPLLLSLGPAQCALTAGNTVLIKVSDLSPRFGALLSRLLEQAFDTHELRLFNGDADFSRHFCRLPFDHLLFTGSPAVGRQVMRAASDNLTPVTLELGGKSPAIVDADADLEAAARRIVIGKTFNAGQTCVAPDYALVPRGRLDAFIGGARRAVERFYPALARGGDYTSIISAHHFSRLQRLVDDAVARGACAWPLSKAPHDAVRRLFPPIALSGLAPEAAALHEEIFGPVLPVLEVGDLDEAIAWINARPRPLALYLFARRQATIDRVLAHTVSGGVTVNDTFLHAGVDSLPFGGIGESGMGAYHGEEGFHTFSHAKPVFLRGRIGLLPWLYPPFGARAERLLRMPRHE
ncbi:aldehyde dehydrogenase family protein [Massilia phyllostachyos]